MPNIESGNEQEHQVQTQRAGYRKLHMESTLRIPAGQVRQQTSEKIIILIILVGAIMLQCTWTTHCLTCAHNLPILWSMSLLVNTFGDGLSVHWCHRSLKKKTLRVSSHTAGMVTLIHQVAAEDEKLGCGVKFNPRLVWLSEFKRRPLISLCHTAVKIRNIWLCACILFFFNLTSYHIYTTCNLFKFIEIRPAHVPRLSYTLDIFSGGWRTLGAGNYE